MATKQKYIKQFKIIIMTSKQKEHYEKTGEILYSSKQQQAAIKAQKKAQLDISVKAEKEKRATAVQKFKLEARFNALSTAQYMRPNSIPGSKAPEYDVTKEAEKIYQWLIKVFK